MLAVDLFAGAGGLSLGFSQAGFDVVLAIEKDQKAAATFQANQPRATVLQEDITRLDPADCLRQLKIRRGDVTVIIGGPPCQGFSESNRRTRSLDNPRNHMFSYMIDFVEAVRPAWVVIENVAGMRTMAKGEILKRIISELRTLGYEAEWRNLQAVDYGVPQLRHRLFVIANRLGCPIPQFTAGYASSPVAPITVEQALSDLPILQNGSRTDFLPYRRNTALTEYQTAMRQNMVPGAKVSGNLVTNNAPHIIERYLHIPQGGNWQNIPPALMKNYTDFSRCHTGIYHRLSSDAPSKVIGNFRKNMLIHPEQNRGLSVREAARLQSFPDNYVFCGLIESQQQQVADAVPPLLAKVVAEAIQRC